MSTVETTTNRLPRFLFVTGRLAEFALRQVLDELAPRAGFVPEIAVPFRIDPILEPIGFGFAASLGRYLEVGHRYPEAALMMGTGNLTELTDVDSAGVNTLLVTICQELAVRSVLTTAVINWARSSVREIDLARRLVLLGILPAVVERDLLSSERRSTNSRPASAPRSLPCREASTPVPSPKASSRRHHLDQGWQPGRSSGMCDEGEA